MELQYRESTDLDSLAPLTDRVAQRWKKQHFTTIGLQTSRVLDLEHVATILCGSVFLDGRVLGRFVMLLDLLSQEVNLPTAQFQAALDWAIEHDWVCRGTNYIELKAAGIHMAKKTLGLLRSA